MYRSSEPPSRWYRRFTAGPAAVPNGPNFRLICLPYAGGSATFFRDWAANLPADIDVIGVHYPGRQDLFTEPPIQILQTLVDRLLVELEPCFDRPFAIFGHSMGAAIAFELTAALQRRQLPPPVHLFLSAIEPPHRSRVQGLDGYTDDELITEIDRWDSPGTELYRHPELGPILIGALRADFSLIETYHRQQRWSDPVTTPISALVGDADPLCTPHDVQAWRDLTTGEFTFRSLPGGHFYLIDEQPEVLELIEATLRR